MLSFIQIAKKLDDFYYNIDPYGYFDNVNSHEEGLIRVKSLLCDPVSARQCLQDIIDMETEGLLPANRNYDELRLALSKYVAWRNKENKVRVIDCVRFNSYHTN